MCVCIVGYAGFLGGGYGRGMGVGVWVVSGFSFGKQC